MDRELKGFRAGGGGRLEGIWGKAGAERCGGCLSDCELDKCEMGVVGGGLMWGMDMGVGGRGCSRGGPCVGVGTCEGGV